MPKRKELLKISTFGQRIYTLQNGREQCPRNDKRIIWKRYILIVLLRSRLPWRYNWGWKYSWPFIDTSTSHSFHISWWNTTNCIARHGLRQGHKLPPIRSVSNLCVMATGQSLQLACMINLSFTLQCSKYTYESDFLIFDNVFQALCCILGWDFITSHKLQLSFFNPLYIVEGPHGTAPLSPFPSPVSSAPFNCTGSQLATAQCTPPTFVQW